MYVHELKKWPQFRWDSMAITPLLVTVRHRQGRVLGHMEALGFELQSEANLEILTLDVVKSSEIEGELLNKEQVRSSIARHLGMEIGGMVPADRHVDGIVEMMLDATQNYHFPLTVERLYGWHAAMFPTGYSGMYKIQTGSWRNNPKDDPMRVVSGGKGRELVHFQAPDADRLEEEMHKLLTWFNQNSTLDPVIKAAIAHLWFVTIHPFDDGNGRITRAITDMLLARGDGSSQRFYSMSAQIRIERKAYYDILEKTQKGSLDITDWLMWFLECLDRALDATVNTLVIVFRKANFWKKSASLHLNKRQVQVLNKLLDGFEGKLTSAKWAKIAKCSQDTALRDIQQLLDAQVLMKESAGGRSTSYIVNETMFEL
ncbi:MAG: Fic family protein [Chitinophaga sp.]|uniref:Fic family protein n=1 Tax=Chitinophaga sp. TaxID=1869181 RepID=UPI0025C5C1E0|nr:Fic family protein [Chitinophaga sp.]MBV8252309.1 Fic family protein [Chitinophaga sp.]